MPLFCELSPTDQLIYLAIASGSGGSVVEDSAVGNPVTFVTDLAKPLRELKVNFLPVQPSGTPSPSNILPITGWTGVNVEHFDENLLTINRTSAQTNQGITYTPIKQDNKTVAVKVEGTRTNTNPFFNLNYVNGTTKSIPPGTYKIFGGTAEVRMQVFYIDAGGTERNAGYSDGSAVTVTIPDDCTASWCRLLTWVDTPVDTVIYPIIMSADSTVSIYHVMWSSSGTIYGGFVDLVTGEVWQTWNGIDLGTKNYTKRSENQNRQIWEATFSDAKFETYASSAYQANAKCSEFDLTTSNGSWTVGKFAPALEGQSKVFIFAFPPNSFANGTECKTAMEGVQLAYELTTPVLITTLTPTQINAIKDQTNTIWSDANGNVEVTFIKKG